MELDIEGIAHEIWATAQLLPDEGIVDGVGRIVEILKREFCGDDSNAYKYFISHTVKGGAWEKER